MEADIVLREQALEQGLGIEFGEFLVLHRAGHDGQALEAFGSAVAPGEGLEQKALDPMGGAEPEPGGELLALLEVAFHRIGEVVAPKPYDALMGLTLRGAKGEGEKAFPQVLQGRGKLG
jgi:hypothetical protein